MKKSVFVIVPNWNGEKDLPACLDSVLAQTFQDFVLVVVDNGSNDSSRDVIEQFKQKDARVHGIYRDKNYGYTGGVNPGFGLAIKEGADFVAPFNNDAVADKDWLKHLAEFLSDNPKYGIAACTILHADGKTIDSTADQYTTWGIPYPRGRDEPASSRYDQDTDIFGASGGASMYRVAMLKKIGLLDQDFFAYYEDIDLSFRAQLAGWKVGFVPKSFVYHEQGKASARLGKRQTDDKSANPFTTKQYMKNLPFILVKDMPLGLLWKVLPRFLLAYNLFFIKAFFDGRGLAALRGVGIFWLKLPKKLCQRWHVQRTKKVSNTYMWSIFVHGLPPNAHKLRRVRSLFAGSHQHNSDSTK